MAVTKTSYDIEQEFMLSVADKTGKSLAEWLREISSSGCLHRNEILNFLTVRGLNYLQAQLMAGIWLNGGKPVYSKPIVISPPNSNK
ncbi:MAG: hypothetical protein JNM00_08055 [Flavobacteriales bacterium]|nr:hypothetical protein [Flavobacteriales bacterium]